jgi:TatD DNase family protein
LAKSCYHVIDTHTHLGDPVFDLDRGEVIEKARTAGLSAIVVVSETFAEAQRNLELAATFPLLRPAAGLYPTHLDLSEAEETIALIRRERDRLVAIGEVGIDYWAVKEESGRECQRLIFLKFVDLSIELDLPLNIHSRSAGRQAITLLLERGACKVQLHAFDGKAASALRGVEAGYFFSVPPSVIRSPQKQKLVRSLPLSSLLVETDSPVLGPAPGERNEPSNALISIDAIAEIKNLEKEVVTEALYENTKQLYGDSIT